ncbi:nitrate reductase molybdenum cofactor assembly chaperone [Mycolicibacterium monacense]|uniref:Nitrate reductase molybdenum cofactor assembly chaperone n=1 Tax=Mycolicibacterium monacense TaxID=85693 RepID=A0AAD1IXR8_MYCMB|nr:nitrate reductase molybdenum cofactor assembly chaperone [Mycolicibacterium monacense]MDA4104140.1 respiratory nitrate reductase subunit delta [Mycolicibacterium monacense DSM 44395]ORB23358.1 nitrate reductase molybdenum cofactor assembly chaperone [Mycolicibacterium monacense DSM 44395]QHP85083.1 nitrate reductase molybdenum cofactor assembly chaperone [Mycolicibacterium monacense DSM 44395]BBZ62083.1 nitrate reductase molybdenum cofactor assembly chaperone [Mycolicibacterium monacense]
MKTAKLFKRSGCGLEERLVWQCASLLLSYPDHSRFDIAERLLAHVDGSAAERLSRTLAALRAVDSLRAAQDYVATFDLRRRATMYLTYWTAGDTRNRGNAMLAFAQVYRAAGTTPPDDEAPDHLPVVLEFAAVVAPEAGFRLLTDHRVPIEVLHRALREADSPYADTVVAVLATLPAATDTDVLRARKLAADGPPAEAVGLQPFTLTVPPRRTQGGS